MAERTVEYDDKEWTCAAPDESEEIAAQSLEPTDVSYPSARRRSGVLRRELSERNLQRATAFPHESTYGSTPSVLYGAAADGTHGNFFPASYRQILAHPAWAARLHKAYTASHRVPYRDARRRYELECANSSDALLMNVFCCGAVRRSSRLAALLGVGSLQSPEFGVRARVPLRDGCDDRTELDLVLRDPEGDLLVEAKLSETDFQTVRPALLERYAEFQEVFDVGQLPCTRGQYRSYQLLRCVLAAHNGHARFAAFLDARRIDLLEDAFLVYRTVRCANLRSRLHVITWQEIAACVPRTLRVFLSEKYGIETQDQFRS